MGDSLHMLYHLQSCLINKIALGEICTPTEANPMIKEIRAIISKQHGGNAGYLLNQYFFQI